MKMKTLPMLILFVALTWTTLDSRAGTADILAKEIIQAESALYHNVANPNPDEAEIQSAVAANSKSRLNWLMLTDESVTEEMRICYAIRILDDLLGAGGRIKFATEIESELAIKKKRLLLAQGLIELANKKKSNKEEMATPRKPSD